MTRPAIPLRRELLLSFSVLFAVAMLIAVIEVAVLLPILETARDATLFLASLIVADMAVLFVFGSYVLRRSLVQPIERLVEDVRRMTEGSGHRVGPMPSPELQSIGESVNTLADHLTRDQRLLAEHLTSLERTNAQLVEARDQVVRAARLASVGTLASGIAHEVGNPLGAILGYVDVARGRAQREGRDTSLLDGVRAEAVRIDRIVRSLLDYARPREVEGGMVSPPRILERVRELLLAQGKLDRVEHVWHVSPDVPPVDVDPSQLEQVLVNLLLNALDAVDGVVAARIEVSLEVIPDDGLLPAPRRASDPSGASYLYRRRRVDLPAAEGELRQAVLIRVADNGPGIPAENMERIFDPFFTTKAPGKGTGLGLSICARLVEGMGGRIDLTSSAEGGALFEVRIPAVSPAPSPDERRDADALEPAARRGARP